MTDPRSVAQRVVDQAWSEYRYPRPAIDAPTPGFRRAVAAALEELADLTPGPGPLPAKLRELAGEIREGR